VPRPHPKEFRDDVVAVARKGEAPIAEIAKDFGISESCLRNWLTKPRSTDGQGRKRVGLLRVVVGWVGVGDPPASLPGGSTELLGVVPFRRVVRSWVSVVVRRRG
jgi:hypothetical protein